jgi:Tfp pilus assembly protein PilP
VVLGADRRALVKISSDAQVAGEDNIYYIKEGMKVGENGAEVKAILAGGIVLVEKIRNVYDQDEYLETVIPVSND